MMTVGASYGSVSDIEVLFTLSALIGLAFSLWNLRDSWDDMQVFRTLNLERQNSRYVVAKNTTKGEAARVLQQAIFLSLGVAAMTLPQQADDLDQPLNYVVIGILFRWGLILCSLAATYKSYLAWQTRRSVYEIEERRKDTLTDKQLDTELQKVEDERDDDELRH